MRIRIALWMVGLTMPTAGCHLANIAYTNLTNEVKIATAEAAEHHRYKGLARQHWEMVRQAEPYQTFSSDYADGFKQSFADYLEFGVGGQPPYVPPHRYWGARYRTPEGYGAIEDWFAGFRHGSAVAQASGYRQFTTLPTAQSIGGVSEIAQPNFPDETAKQSAPNKVESLGQNTPQAPKMSVRLYEKIGIMEPSKPAEVPQTLFINPPKGLPEEKKATEPPAFGAGNQNGLPIITTYPDGKRTEYLKKEPTSKLSKHLTFKPVEFPTKSNGATFLKTPAVDGSSVSTGFLIIEEAVPPSPKLISIPKGRQDVSAH